MDRNPQRLRYLAHHRGTKENDYLLGSFANKHLETLTTHELNQFDALLQQPDHTIFFWLTEKQGKNHWPDYCKDILSIIHDFHQK
jgi:antitoxin CptB